MIYLLLAAYNEENDLPKLLDGFFNQGWQEPYKIIMVNDGSNDGTLAVARYYCEKLPIVIINHEKNMGLGRALSTGWNFASQTLGVNDILITMDADNTHPVSLIPDMVKKINDGYDMVIASRYAKGGHQTGVPPHRQFLSFVARYVLGTICSIKGTKDFTSGFRAFSGRLVKKMNENNFKIEQSGFTATFEILIKASRFSDKITEVPLLLQYGKKGGRSKMKILKTIFAYLSFLFQKSGNLKNGK